MFEIGFHVITGYFNRSVRMYLQCYKELSYKVSFRSGKTSFSPPLMSASNIKSDLAFNHDNAAQLAQAFY